MKELSRCAAGVIMIDSSAFLRIEDALCIFADAGVNIQGQGHITPFHKHIAVRLVVEGGFSPNEVTPHPPITRKEIRGKEHLFFDPTVATKAEQTVLGGLKSKDIDVVVAKHGVGPVVAISVKGTTRAFRNLTNRMEEAIGDSTNLHIMYPGLVYGFFHVLRVNRAGEPGIDANDVSVMQDGSVVNSVRRFHDVLLGLAGRRLVRDDYTRYEAVAFALVETELKSRGNVFSAFPIPGSLLASEKFFKTMYEVYDLRFPYVGTSMPVLKRNSWAPDSPLFEDLGGPDHFASKLGYVPRID